MNICSILCTIYGAMLCDLSSGIYTCILYSGKLSREKTLADR